jgi:L,D-transpeptidase catalytic domain
MLFRKKNNKRSIYTHYSKPNRGSAANRNKKNQFVKPAILIFGLLVLVAGLGMIHHMFASRHVANNVIAHKDNNLNSAISNSKKQTTISSPISVNYCSTNKLNYFILVSISKRQLWACSGPETVYNSLVVTGMENLPADLTPTGVYHIYAKQTKLYLNGSDSTGSWHDYVYYWMPFLANSYGVYGFHDATWRQSNAFGNISPYSTNASHGCVETPLATAKWLYNWAPVGTEVSIEG